MSRTRRLLLMFVIAASVGLFLAYRHRADRETAKPNADALPGSAEVVRAEPKPEEPTPVAPVGGQRKPDEPVPPRAEPGTDPAPDDPALARKAAYVRIVAALEGVEAAAVQKYGRKPRPDDKAAFAIPYKAYVNDQAQRARKRLAKALELTEGEIDQIKAEGDRAGWPKK